MNFYRPENLKLYRGDLLRTDELVPEHGFGHTLTVIRGGEAIGYVDVADFGADSVKAFLLAGGLNSWLDNSQ